MGTTLTRIAASVRALHDLPATGCPWWAGPEVLLASARTRVGSGAVDPSRFDPPYQRHDPDDLLRLATEQVPAAPADPVVTHGQARLDALAVDDGELVWLDVEAVGLGDRYRDLAVLAVELAEAISPNALGPFLDAYGIDQPDLVRLDWYVLIDQLLR